MPLALEVGAFSIPGQKTMHPNWQNQDTHVSMWLSDTALLVGVFDGHGENGHLVADRVKGIFEQYMPGLIERHTLPEAFHRVFAAAQSMLELDESLSRYSGTTVAVAVMDLASGLMTTAHAGDSRLVFVHSGEVQYETADHVIGQEEASHIVARGGEVREMAGNGTVLRIFAPGRHVPGLAMARSLGDLEAHSFGASSEPEVGESVPFLAGSTIVVGSDGLWDRLTPGFVASWRASRANLTSVPDDSQDNARGLALAARARWPAEGDIDDITALVVQVHHLHHTMCGERSSSSYEKFVN